MTTAYEVDIDFNTPPLKRHVTLTVFTRAEALRLKELGKSKGYEVTSYKPKSVLSAEDAIRWLDREVLESERAGTGRPRAEG